MVALAVLSVFLKSSQEDLTSPVKQLMVCDYSLVVKLYPKEIDKQNGKKKREKETCTHSPVVNNKETEYFTE